jgi:hypothetical protein
MLVRMNLSNNSRKKKKIIYIYIYAEVVCLIDMIGIDTEMFGIETFVQLDVLVIFASVYFVQGTLRRTLKKYSKVNICKAIG